MKKRSARPRIVVVDGYTTAHGIADELAGYDVEDLHLHSSAQRPRCARSFDPTRYASDLGHADSAKAAAELLSVLRPDAVVAGSDCGVAFAEQISALAGLPTNRSERAITRRDKWAMADAVRTHGLLAPDCIQTAKLEEALSWAGRHARWPVVVKPLASSRSDGVAICHSHRDVALAFQNALGKVNLLGTRNDRLLVQSFVSGPLFTLNSVSVNGLHNITDAWAISLRSYSGSPVPGELHLIDLDHACAPRLADFTRRALTALGVENGPAQTDVVWTNNGPVLLEIGAHLMDTPYHRRAYEAASLPSQASVLAKTLTDLSGERRRTFAAGQYKFHKYFTKILLPFSVDGGLSNAHRLALLRSLASFEAYEHRFDDSGFAQHEPADGIAYLAHESADQIARDVRTIREWESGDDLDESSADHAAAHTSLDPVVPPAQLGLLMSAHPGAWSALP